MTMAPEVLRGMMAFEYAWLKILQTLFAAKRPMSVEELRKTLAATGFRFQGSRLEEGVARLQGQGLVETLLYAGGGLDSIASVSITAAGERKVRGIVHY